VSYSDLWKCKPYRSVDDSPDPENLILPSGAFASFVFNDSFAWEDNPPFTALFDEWKITFDTEWGWTYQPLSEEYTAGIKWMRNNTAFPLSFEYPEQDPHFIRWMRAEASQTIVKEYAICSDCSIPAGVYGIRIHNRYPTAVFGGTKSIVITEESSLGDRSLFLGVVQLVFATLVCIFTIFYMVIQIACPRGARTHAGAPGAVFGHVRYAALARN
jgi:hypothetical protein